MLQQKLVTMAVVANVGVITQLTTKAPKLNPLLARLHLVTESVNEQYISIKFMYTTFCAAQLQSN